jgi:predicted O-methyltransferase YrrM
MNYIEPNPAIDGWMDEAELQWLFEKGSEMGNIVEVGSWMGRSTHALLSGCKGTVYAVDHFKGSPSEIDSAHSLAKTEDIYAIFLKNLSGFTNLSVLKMDSLSASKLFKDKEIELVFLDPDHEYPAIKEIIETWLPKTRRLLCGHDVAQGGTPRAFEELNLNPKREVGTLWSIEI